MNRPACAPSPGVTGAIGIKYNVHPANPLARRLSSPVGWAEDVARWCSGSTMDFGSIDRGSNPRRAARTLVPNRALSAALSFDRHLELPRMLQCTLCKVACSALGTINQSVSTLAPSGGELSCRMAHCLPSVGGTHRTCPGMSRRANGKEKAKPPPESVNGSVRSAQVRSLARRREVLCQVRARPGRQGLSRCWEMARRRNSAGSLRDKLPARDILHSGRGVGATYQRLCRVG